jgi:hypothetical protein
MSILSVKTMFIFAVNAILVVKILMDLSIAAGDGSMLYGTTWMFAGESMVLEEEKNYK